METKDLTVFQTTESAKGQTAEVTPRKCKTAKRTSVQESGQKASPGSGGVEDVERADVTDCRKIWVWFEFLRALLNRKRNSLPRAIKRKIREGDFLSKDEAKILVESGNVKYCKEYLKSLQYGEKSEEIVQLIVENDNPDLLRILYYPDVRENCCFSDTDDRPFVVIDEPYWRKFLQECSLAMFKVYFAGIRSLNREILYGVLSYADDDKFQYFFHRYGGYRCFSDIFTLQASIRMGCFQYVQRQIEKGPLFGRGDEEVLVKYGDARLVRFYIRAYDFHHPFFAEYALIERGDEELLKLYIDRRPFKWRYRCEPLFVRKANSDLVRTYIEKYGLVVDLDTLKALIGRGEPELEKLFIEKTKASSWWKMEQVLYLLKNGAASSVKAYILRYGLPNDAESEQVLMAREDEELIMCLIGKRQFSSAIVEAKFVRYGGFSLVRFYVGLYASKQRCKMAEELIRRNNGELFEAYIKQCLLTEKEEAMLIEFGSVGLFLIYINYRRLFEANERYFFAKGNSKTVAVYRKKYGL